MFILYIILLDTYPKVAPTDKCSCIVYSPERSKVGPTLLFVLGYNRYVALRKVP